jgi:hypothetical protein
MDRGRRHGKGVVTHAVASQSDLRNVQSFELIGLTVTEWAQARTRAE